MMYQLFNEITKVLVENLEINVLVAITCDDIHLTNYHSLTLIEATENETSFRYTTTDLMTFSIGKNVASIDYDEYENEYIMKYNNGITIIVTII